MKRGFTLIELLAVIVILAIIALIATPIVLSIIDETKNNASLRSAEFYLDAVEQSILMATLNNRTITDGVYNIIDGDICLNIDCTDKLEVEVNGEKPGSGTISIQNGKIENIDIIIGDNKVVLNDNKDVIHFPCTLIKGDEETPGSKYECEVKPGTKYNFYVLSKEEDGTTNLIMDRNICEDGTFASTDNRCFVAWISKSSYECDESNCAQNDKGPITVINYIYNTTKDWINIPNIVINYQDENSKLDGSKGTSGYGGIITTNNITTITAKDGNVTASYASLKARLPEYSEVHGNGKCLTKAENGNQYGSCPLWLVDYLHYTEDSSSYYNEENGKTSINGIYGYWVLSSNGNVNNSAWRVSHSGYMSYDSVDNNASRGIRPVINIKL